MKVSLSGLKALCQSHVVELKFNRRRMKPGFPTSRRMLCTLDRAILQSPMGKQILHFRPPTQSPAYNAASYGLLTVWDIIQQDWRNIPVEAVDVVASVTTKPPEKFWEWFINSVAKMPSGRKAEFQNK